MTTLRLLPATLAVTIALARKLNIHDVRAETPRPHGLQHSGIGY